MDSTDPSSAQEPAVEGWSNPVFPWLLSLGTHLALLLTLALSAEAPSGAARRAATTTGIALSTVQLSVATPRELATVELSAEYFADESEAPSEEMATTAAGGSLAELLREDPAVDLSGVLPSKSGVLGRSSLEGTGIGDAQNAARPSAGDRRPRGATVRTGVFGVVGEGQKFAYVFDRSASMDGHGGLPLAAAKAELINSLHDLDSIHQFQIIFYNHEARVFELTGSPGRLVFGNDQNKRLAEKFVGSVTADGATHHMDALTTALRMGPDVIFFLTDADEPQMTADELARIRRINHGTSIHAIEFGYGVQTRSENFLAKLARQNGGTHLYVDISTLHRRS